MQRPCCGSGQEPDDLKAGMRSSPATGEAPCQTLSRKEGKCACSNPRQAKVKSVGEGTAVLVFVDREQTFKTVGKFMCACGPECKCDTISQNPGKCACGVDMVEVKK
jgi:hypothetical protein